MRSILASASVGGLSRLVGVHSIAAFVIVSVGVGVVAAFVASAVGGHQNRSSQKCSRHCLAAGSPRDRNVQLSRSLTRSVTSLLANQGHTSHAREDATLKTVVVNNQKGGVGKTTLAAHIGWYLGEVEGARTLVIDTDPQKNLTSVFTEAHAHQGPPTTLFFTSAVEPVSGPVGVTLFPADQSLDTVPTKANTAVGQFIQNMARLRDCYDYCVIDTAPTWGATTFAALASASGMLSPMDLGKFSRDGLIALFQQLASINQQVRSARPVELFGVIVSRYVSQSPNQRQKLALMTETYGETILFPGVVTNRQSYDQALDSDAGPTMPVWRMKDNQAALEAGREIREILGKLRDRLDKSGDAL